MMRLPDFKFVSAQTLAEASAILADDPAGTRVVAGGTDLWPNMKRRHEGAHTVVGLRRVPGLRGIERADGGGGNGAGEVRVGALTTLSEIVRNEELRAGYPGLVKAVASISTPVLRNMGTIGGNLALDTRCTYLNQNEEWRRAIGYCMKAAGEICWVRPSGSRCLAVSSTDSAPLLCAIGARVRLISSSGERVLALRDLYADDGIEYMTKRRDEIITEILLPPAEGVTSTYWKLRRRGSIDFPVLGVGVALGGDVAREVLEPEIWLVGIQSHPVRADGASDFIEGRALTRETIAQAAALARKEAAVSDNTDFEPGWRRHMVEVYVAGALEELRAAGA